MLKAGEDPRGERVVNRGKPHIAEHRFSAARRLEERHVLQVHVAVGDQPCEEHAPQEDQQIVLRGRGEGAHDARNALDRAAVLVVGLQVERRTHVFHGDPSRIPSALANVETFDQQGRGHAVRHADEGGRGRSKPDRAREFQSHPLDQRHRLEAVGPCRLQDMRERQPHARREHAVCDQIHRGLDLYAGQTRRVGAGVEGRESTLEILLDGASARACVVAREEPVFCEGRQFVGQKVCRKRCQVANRRSDGDVRHVAFARAQQRTFIAVILQHRFEPALGQQ
jgi:hypothetical protein